MYEVTYKNVLRSDKTPNDYQNWLEKFWPIQKEWGASSFKIWNDENYVFCRYIVKNIDLWNEFAMKPEAEPLVQALNKVVEMNRLSIKIKFLNFQNA